VAVSFSNNWKLILDKLEAVIETEFKGALPVYKGVEIPKGINQALQLIPDSDVLSEYNINSETREYTINVKFIFAEANVNEKALDHILRQVSRIGALIHDNMTMTLSDSTTAFNCRFESTDLNTEADSNAYVVDWVWKGQHLGNTD
tara:strand:- start:84 stop:521 length:438 start_codon:yes stop_codon:yes gene_type:complete